MFRTYDLTDPGRLPVVDDGDEYVVACEVLLPDRPYDQPVSCYLVFGEVGKQPAIHADDKETAAKEAQRLGKQLHGHDAVILIRDLWLSEKEAADE